VNAAFLPDECEVAVIGAGPYGLAMAAHLKAAGLGTRTFGDPMSSWRDSMPKGMKLLSPWNATHIADPAKRFSLDRFWHQHALERQEQIALEQFVGYGEWFAQQTVPDLDDRKVLRIEDTGRGFCFVLEDGEPLRARRIVVAMGLTNQQAIPTPFEGSPEALVSHASSHARLDKWRGKRVAVVGRGQRACESAALLREAGSDVELICRGDVLWREPPNDGSAHEREWLVRLRQALAAPSAVGPFPLSWLNELPGVAHRVTGRVLPRINAHSLRPAAAWWLKPRFNGVRLQAGRRILGVMTLGNQVGVELDTGLRVYDHVLLATGYDIDISKLRILAPDLLERIVCTDGSPVLGAGFESSVPGLHFVGASAAASFGPLMRFIAGARYAARSVTRAALAHRPRARRTTQDSGRTRPLNA
jgi:cation diffusion facilitator CzcD-associated flavoprotein CzcO